MSLFGLGSAALNEGYSANSVIYTQATFAALFHLINHSTFKGALFMVVGIIDHECRNAGYPEAWWTYVTSCQ